MRPASDSVTARSARRGKRAGQVPRFRRAAKDEDTLDARLSRSCRKLPHRRAGCPSSASARTASRAWARSPAPGRQRRNRVRRRAASGACRAADPRRARGLAEPVLARHRRGARRARPHRSACSPRAIRSSMASARCWRATSPPDEMLVVPAPSAFSLAAARLGWALPETALVSLHGRALDLIRPHLHPGARILALTSDGEGPGSARAAADRVGLRRLAADGARSARRRKRAHARSTTAETSTIVRRRRAQHGRHRGRGGAGARRSSPSAPGSPMICSSMTARSPSARSAR